MNFVPNQILKDGLPHRPWPYPNRLWAIRQDWVQLSFLHWDMEPSSLQSLIPAPLELDLFEGKAYLGLVPFLMDTVRPRFLPCVPGISRFPELNIRTYVRYNNIPGVLFFSLDAASRIAVWFGRKGFHVPYFFASMSIKKDGDTTHYTSVRHGQTAGENRFRGSITTREETYYSTEGSLEHWLTERYCFYAAHPNGRMMRCDVAHKPWPLKKAVAEIEENTLVQSFGIENHQDPPLVHESAGVQVLGWRPEFVSPPLLSK